MRFWRVLSCRTKAGGGAAARGRATAFSTGHSLKYLQNLYAGMPHAQGIVEANVAKDDEQETVPASDSELQAWRKFVI